MLPTARARVQFALPTRSLGTTGIAGCCALLFVACAGSSPSPPETVAAPVPAGLDGTAWQLERWPGHAIPQPPDGQQPTLEFTGDRVAGHLPCNAFSGAVTIAGESIRFGALLSTKRACPALQAESDLVQALGRIARFERDPRRLVLFDAAGEVLAYALVEPGS